MVRIRGRMKLIENENTRKAAFSKRKLAIFTKASELCTLCAVQMAAVIFSPSGKAYSFGNPSADAVFNKFMNPEGSSDDFAAQEGGSHSHQQSALAGYLQNQHSELLNQLEAEKKRKEEYKQQLSNLPIDRMDKDQLIELKGSLENLKQQVQEKKAELLQSKMPESPLLTLGGIYSKGDAGTSAIDN